MTTLPRTPAPVDPVEATPRRPRWAATEVGAAVVLLGMVALGGLRFRLNPGPTRLDVWVWSFLRAHLHSPWFGAITRIGSVPVTLAVAVLAAAVCFRTDRRRALACIVGPLLAIGVAELVIKPWVGRTYEGVLTYPSGTVAAAAAAATVVVLACRGPWRVPAVFVAAAAVAFTSVAVVVLRWHYATDAAAGVFVGCGCVLLVDGAAHLASPRRRSPPG